MARWSFGHQLFHSLAGREVVLQGCFLFPQSKTFSEDFEKVEIVLLPEMNPQLQKRCHGNVIWQPHKSIQQKLYIFGNGMYFHKDHS